MSTFVLENIANSPFIYIFIIRFWYFFKSRYQFLFTCSRSGDVHDDVFASHLPSTTLNYNNVSGKQQETSVMYYFYRKIKTLQILKHFLFKKSWKPI